MMVGPPSWGQEDEDTKAPVLQGLLPEDQALRLNTGKPVVSEVLKFGSALEKLAKVMELGAVKYEQDNWLKGGKDDQEYLDALIRHVMHFIQAEGDDEEYDVDSGCHHMAHAAWNALALLRLNRNLAADTAGDFSEDAYRERWS